LYASVTQEPFAPTRGYTLRPRADIKPARAWQQVVGNDRDVLARVLLGIASARGASERGDKPARGEPPCHGGRYFCRDGAFFLIGGWSVRTTLSSELCTSSVPL